MPVNPGEAWPCAGLMHFSWQIGSQCLFVRPVQGWTAIICRSTLKALPAHAEQDGRQCCWTAFLVGAHSRHSLHMQNRMAGGAGCEACIRTGCILLCFRHLSSTAATLLFV
eukprot:1160675-Pelagomonas_calceolata.AAC.20